VSQTSDWVVRQLGSETVVYDRRTHRAHCLGRVAAAIWRAQDGSGDPRQVVRRASAALREPVDEETFGRVWRRLKRAGLVRSVGSGPITEQPVIAAGTRRRLVRGLGAAAGLMVLSVATRSPAQAAATCLRNGEPCTRSSHCCSHCCNVNSSHCSGGGECAQP
jgi:hypothetical protein